MPQSRLSLHKHMRRLQDPRLNRRKRHLLGDILTIAVCADLAAIVKKYLTVRGLAPGAYLWPGTWSQKASAKRRRGFRTEMRPAACSTSTPSGTSSSRTWPASALIRRRRRLWLAIPRSP